MTDYSPTKLEDDDDDHRTTMARRAAWWLIGGIAALLAIIVVLGLRQPTGEPGPLTETLYALPADVPATLLSDVSSIWGLNSWSSTSRSHLSGGVSLGDLDGDGLDDLVIAGGTVAVFLNDGTHFTLVDDPTTLLPSDALSTLIIDLDGPDSLYSRDAKGQWTDIARDVGVAMEVDGMGVTVADLTGDGTLDGYVSDLGGNEFLERVGPGFVSSVESGALRIRPPGADDGIVSSSWGSGAADVNLDGIIDLVVVNGGMPFSRVENKISGTLIEVDDPPAILIGLGDGIYADAWPSGAIDWTGAGRGLALGDIDNDGDTDMVITRLDGSPILLLNDSTAPAVTVLPLFGCSPYGAVVSVATTHGTVTQLLGSFSFAGGHAPGVIVGQAVEGSQITVEWPGTGVAHTLVPSGDRPTVTVDCIE